MLGVTSADADEAVAIRLSADILGTCSLPPLSYARKVGPVLAIMQPFRKTTSIRALAIVVIAGIVMLSAACSGGGSAQQMTGPYNSTGSGG